MPKVKYANSNPRKKLGRYRVEPVVFLVHRNETGDGRFHQVSWAVDGNLNASYRRGDVKRFRKMALARAFARKKAKEMGAELVVS